MGQNNENTMMLLHILGGVCDDTGNENDQHTGYLKRQMGIIPFHLLHVGCSPTLDLVPYYLNRGHALPSSDFMSLEIRNIQIL